MLQIYRTSRNNNIYYCERKTRTMETSSRVNTKMEIIDNRLYSIRLRLYTQRTIFHQTVVISLRFLFSHERNEYFSKWKTRSAPHTGREYITYGRRPRTPSLISHCFDRELVRPGRSHPTTTNPSLTSKIVYAVLYYVCTNSIWFCCGTYPYRSRRRFPERIKISGAGRRQAISYCTGLFSFRCRVSGCGKNV